MSTEDIKKLIRQQKEISFLNTIALILFDVVLLLLVVYMVSGKIESVEEFQTPGVVIEFLDLAIRGDEALQQACERYLATTGPNAFISGDTPGQDYIHFGTILYSCVESIGRYEITFSSRNYVEFLLYAPSGDPIYPKVAMLYSLSENGTMIEDYSIARLQPFSTKDKEYNEFWR